MQLEKESTSGVTHPEFLVHNSPMSEQDLDAVSAPRTRRNVERGALVHLFQLNVCASPEKGFGNLHVSHLARQVQSAPALLGVQGAKAKYRAQRRKKRYRAGEILAVSHPNPTSALQHSGESFSPVSASL